MQARATLCRLIRQGNTAAKLKCQIYNNNRKGLFNNMFDNPLSLRFDLPIDISQPIRHKVLQNKAEDYVEQKCEPQRIVSHNGQ